MDNFNPDNNLKRLEEIAKSFIPFERGKMFDFKDTRAYYSCVTGECYGVGLKKEGKVGVIDAVMSENCELHAHDHKVTEIISVYEGEMISETATETRIIKEGETIVYPVGERHIQSQLTVAK
jgi:quercetin dioxygenase-like cupin family protein